MYVNSCQKWSKCTGSNGQHIMQHLRNATNPNVAVGSIRSFISLAINIPTQLIKYSLESGLHHTIILQG
jgi:hypothetical protein